MKKETTENNNITNLKRQLVIATLNIVYKAPDGNLARAMGWYCKGLMAMLEEPSVSLGRD